MTTPIRWAPDPEGMYSQSADDAFLRSIFEAIGTTNKFAVDFGAGDGVTISNTAYFRLHEGWDVLLLDKAPLADGIVQEHITAENINAVFAKHRVPRAFDLLSIDVDGMDYWLWKALAEYEPRVIIVEYNYNFEPDESLVVPYDPDYVWDGSPYYGASLRALWSLGKSRGYDLVIISRVPNALFVKSHLLHESDRGREPHLGWCGGEVNTRLAILQRPWQQV